MKLSANDKPHRLVVRSSREWQRVAMAEVLIPEVPNAYGDYWTEDSIVEAAYMFMEHGFGLDLEHDHQDMSAYWHIVESFIAREGDPDFIKGSWVVGIKILDDDTWNAILSGDINGFSYEALVEYISGVLYVEDDGVRQGVTEPSVIDGHTHRFGVMLGADGRPIAGGTTIDNGHEHEIRFAAVTEEADGHVHRYNLVQGKDGK